MKTSKNDKMLIRLLTLASKSGRHGINFEITDKCIVLRSKQRAQTVPVSTFDLAISDDLLTINDCRLMITKCGISNLKRHLCDFDPFANQHRVLQSSSVKIQNQVQQVNINHAESPLARLFARKQKNGSRFFTLAQYEAGGRLRRDFEKAQMQPSISARWREGISTGNTTSAGGGSSELSDFAIDARARLENALNAVGPELAGVTLDICCYLKGFEHVERERGWPGRSAKLMLKTALAALARHYGYGVSAKNPEFKSSVSQWGARDYRPHIKPVGQQYT